MRKYIPILVTACTLLFVSGGYVLAQIGGGVGWFDIIQDVRITGELQVNGSDGVTAVDFTSTDDITSGDDMTVTDDLVVSGSLSVTGNSTLGEDVLVDNYQSFTKQTRIVVTDGSTITPLGTYAPISSTATTGTSSITAGERAGQLLILHNVGSNTITLTDTGTLHLTGNGTMTADDSTILVWDGSAWNQIAAESAN
jgi:hypothetical protein